MYLLSAILAYKTATSPSKVADIFKLENKDDTRYPVLWASFQGETLSEEAVNAQRTELVVTVEEVWNGM